MGPDNSPLPVHTPHLLLQELEAERAALVARQGELQARLEEGAKLSKEEEEALAAMEAEIAALKVREAELPKEVSE